MATWNKMKELLLKDLPIHEVGMPFTSKHEKLSSRLISVNQVKRSANIFNSNVLMHCIYRLVGFFNDTDAGKQVSILLAIIR